MDEKNDARFMRIALGQARTALAAGEFPVGCILVHADRVVAVGARQGTGLRNEIDHAEMVALKRFTEVAVKPDPAEVTAYCTMEPCLMCYGALLIHGIGRIVYAYEDVMGGGTSCDLSDMPPLYRQCCAEVVPRVLRTESLSLFKTFFQDPSSLYWRGSLLAEYTLSQPERPPMGAAHDLG